MNTITVSTCKILQRNFKNLLTKRLTTITNVSVQNTKESDDKNESESNKSLENVSTNYSRNTTDHKAFIEDQIETDSKKSLQNVSTTYSHNTRDHKALIEDTIETENKLHDNMDDKALTTEHNHEYELIDFNKLDIIDKPEKKSVLEKCEEDISHVAPYLKPTFNFATYVNQSTTLQELLKLGVNLHKLEKKVTVPPFIMGLDFEKDIKNHVIFLHELGLDLDTIGASITKNPYIFKENLEDLQVRINYLESKKFNQEQIVRIVGHNPYWLMFSTKKIDTRLGFFQKEFNLTGAEVRHITVKQPRLITYSLQSVKTNMFAIKEEMCFTDEERKELLLSKPNLFMKEQNKLLEIFTYIHREMNIPTEIITKIPGVLTCRLLRLQQRHKFLEKLGKAQYDPKKPMYVSVLTAMSGSDAEFCLNIAKCSLESFYTFIKTM